MLSSLTSLLRGFKDGCSLYNNIENKSDGSNTSYTLHRKGIIFRGHKSFPDDDLSTGESY